MGPIGGMEEQFIDRLFSIIPCRCHLGCVRFSEGGIGCLDWVYGWLFCLSLQGEEEDGLGSRWQTDYLEASHVEGLMKAARIASISVAALFLLTRQLSGEPETLTEATEVVSV